MRRTILFLIILGLAGAAYMATTMLSPDVDGTAMRANPPVVVAVVIAREDLWLPSIKATGSLRAFQGVDVTVQEAGMVTAIFFESGSTVNKGALLVQQYVEDEVVRLDGLKSELSLAKKSYDRSQSLIGRKAVSQSQLDSTQSDLERMTALARSVGAQVIFVTPASSLNDCTPFKSQHTPSLDPEAQKRLEQILVRGKKAMGEENWQEALKLLETAAAEDPRWAVISV